MPAIEIHLFEPNTVLPFSSTRIRSATEIIKSIRPSVGRDFGYALEIENPMRKEITAIVDEIMCLNI
jgi:hypothetical protein